MNIVYNASAGTGKTYQVTQLYEGLVLKEGIDPREILLMTFT
jgi:ATP-dependent exoDNAse (exonuclease V) beta subunit